MAEMSIEHNFGDEIDATLLGEDFTISNIKFHVSLPEIQPQIIFDILQ